MQASVRADEDDPVNTAVVVGSDVAFSCSRRPRANTSSSFRWFHYRPFSVQPVVVHTGLHLRRQFAARHDVTGDRTTGHSRLTVRGVRLEDAGVYSCYELSASRTAVRLAVQLVVLGKTSSTSTSGVAAVDSRASVHLDLRPPCCQVPRLKQHQRKELAVGGGANWGGRAVVCPLFVPNGQAFMLLPYHVSSSN